MHRWTIVWALGTVGVVWTLQTCTLSGTWGPWQSWTDCSTNGVQNRMRDCDPLPTGCIASSPFVCSGSYNMTESCDSGSGDSGAAATTTIAATVGTSRRSSTAAATTIAAAAQTTAAATSTSTSTSTTTSTAAATTTTITLGSGNNNAVSSCDWSTWGDWSACTDTCGNCGTQQRFRSCPTTNCTCTGVPFEKVNCNGGVCLYPRSSCCSGFTPSSVNNTFLCVNSTSGR